MAYDNVVLVPMALSGRRGRLSLCVPSGSGRTHAASLEVRSDDSGARSESVEVDVTTLDSFFANQTRGPNFLKIDVEGHESSVLDGGRETLERHRPALLIESEGRHRMDGDVRTVFDMLESLGYVGSFFNGGRRRPLTDFKPAVHQCIDPKSSQVPRGYVNNFAFEPSAER
jgi:FkbM family methyltransferase